MATDQQPWENGLEQWWEAMSASRRWFEDLGTRVDALSRDGAPVQVRDLQAVLEALQLMEARLAENERLGGEVLSRLEGVEVSMAGLREQVGVVAQTVGALGGHVEKAFEALAAQAAPSSPPVKKPSTRSKQ